MGGDIIAKKVYAVANGKKTGLYFSWQECQKQVKGFPNAVFQGFADEQQAKNWLQQQKKVTNQAPLPQLVENNEPLAPPTLPETLDLVVWSDGGCRNHGNFAGGAVKANDVAAWAYLIYDGKTMHQDTAGKLGATNNKMELLGLINALNYLKTTGATTKKILVVLDSKYVLDGICKGWLRRWEQNGWKTTTGAVKNKSQWQQLVVLLRQFSAMQFRWTKGHANDWGNNYVDELLNQTMDLLAKGEYK